MRHRFLISPIASPGARVTLTGDEHHHARVARVRDGEGIELFDGQGHAAAARVISVGHDETVVEVLEPIESRESPLRLRLAMALIHPDLFELVLQKATELGVAAIMPILTERTEVRAERVRGKAERWEKIILEAVKQCGRATIPRLDPLTDFEQAIQVDGPRLLFDADAPPRPASSAANATLFIGPQGGWSEAEIRAAIDCGASIERLGPRRLRAETAAIAAVTSIGARFGDLSQVATGSR